MHRLLTFHLPELRLPSLRMPNLRRPTVRLRRPEVDLDDPRRFTEPLRFFFYLLIFVALLAILTGATGSGLLMLIAGAGLHVVRSSLEELAARRRARRERAERKREIRLRSHRAARKAREEVRVAPAPRVAARHRPVVPQPPPSSVPKQRVV